MMLPATCSGRSCRLTAICRQSIVTVPVRSGCSGRLRWQTERPLSETSAGSEQRTAAPTRRHMRHAGPHGLVRMQSVWMEEGGQNPCSGLQRSGCRNHVRRDAVDSTARTARCPTGILPARRVDVNVLRILGKRSRENPPRPATIGFPQPPHESRPGQWPMHSVAHAVAGIAAAGAATVAGRSLPAGRSCRNSWRHTELQPPPGPKIPPGPCNRNFR